MGTQMEVATAGCQCQLTFYGLNSELDNADSGDTGIKLLPTPNPGNLPIGLQ
jgi:hypothetical protein